MKLFTTVLALVITSQVALGFPYADPEPLVTTKYGEIRGSYMTARNGRCFRAFRGIPYAKPPIGDLRFKSPEKPDHFGEIPLDARNDKNFCIQKNYFFKNPKVEGSEDCLYLNVYAPKVNSYYSDDTQLLPVMVFIHWGGFFAGRATSDYLGPEYFLDQDIILVTFNYRLGVLGFFSTLDDSAPGNYGFKDQVAALEWVQENIQNFGGDSKKVTIFGQSAGGGSVHLHLLSPLSRGLFSAAISQSGAALALWSKPSNAIQPMIIKNQAEVVDCGGLNGNDELVECLRKVDAKTLVESGDKFKTFENEPLTVYGIVTETETEANPKPFITKEPLEYIQNGEFQDVPWIIGVVEDEGILRASPLLRNSETREALNENFAKLLPQILLLPLSVGFDEALTRSLYKNITESYLGGDEKVDISHPEKIQGFIDLYTDRSFKYGTYQSVMLHSAKGHQNIWLYNFNYKGQHTYGDLFAATDENIEFNWGVSHCDDLLYLFRSPALLSELDNERDIQMSKDMIKYWTNFAKYRVPWEPSFGTYGFQFDPTLWKQVEVDNNMRNDDLFYLSISGRWDSEEPIRYSYQNGFHKDRMNFWSRQQLSENFPGLN